jgi:DNA polymerase III sliding clamp (beta) subunit (PCNA family)
LNEIFKLPPSTSVAVTSSFTVPISGDVDAIDNDEVEVEFFGTMKPFILKPKADDSVTQLILPIICFWF